MWTTTFKHGKEGLQMITHNFGYGIRVEVDLEKGIIQRIHGAIIVNEWETTMTVKEFHNLLISIQQEIQSK